MLALGFVLVRIVRLGGDAGRTRDARADDPARCGSPAPLALQRSSCRSARRSRSRCASTCSRRCSWSSRCGRRSTVGRGCRGRHRARRPGEALPARARARARDPVAGPARPHAPRQVRAVAAAITTVLVLGPFVVLAGGDAFGFLRYQAERGLQIESIGGGLAVLVGLIAGHADRDVVRVQRGPGGGPVRRSVAGRAADRDGRRVRAARPGSAGAGSDARPRSRQAGGRRRGPSSLFATASVLVLLATSKVFSIQYVVWIVPFAALLRGRQFWLAAAARRADDGDPPAAVHASW